MNSSLKNKESIREYLLGRVIEDSVLSELEELLFMDEEFCTEVEIAEDQLINDYVFDRLDPEDKADFEKTLANNPERSLSVQLATALKEKARTVSVPTPQKVDFFDNIAAFFRRPLYAVGFAAALIGIVVFSYVLLSRRTTNELAELQGIYKQQRQTETRISDFVYAPMAIVRGDDMKEDDQRKLRRIEIPLLDAVESSAGPKAHHDLGVFYLNKRNFPEAIKYLDLAAKADAENAKFHNDLGSAYFEFAKSGSDEKKFENMARSIEEFSRALELNPDMLEALFNKSLALQERLPGQARASWNLYLQKDSTSKWAEEARKHLTELEQKQSNSKTKEQVLDDFLTAFQKKDDEAAWRINCQTKDVYFGVWLPDQLSRRYVRAKLKDDIPEAEKSIEALKYIGNLEKERNADFFVADLTTEIYQAARTNAEKLNSAQEAFDSALLHMRDTDYPNALRVFQKSGRLFLLAGYSIGDWMAKYWIMQALRGLGRARDALRKIDSLLSFTRSKDYKWFEASVIYFSGIISFLQTQPSKAIDSCKVVLKSSIALGDTLLEQRSRVVIVETLIETNEYQKAISYRFGDDEDLYYNGGLSKWRNYYNDARLLLRLKLFNAGFEYAQEDLTAARNIHPFISDVLTSSQMLLEEVMAGGRLEDALKLATGSLELIDTREDNPFKFSRQADVTLRIAELKSKLGRCEEGVTDFRKAILLFDKNPEFDVDRYAAHKGLLMCFKALGRSAEIASELETVLPMAESYNDHIIPDESRQAFFENERAVFDVAIEDSLNRGDGTEAFQRAERAKAISLQDLISDEKSLNDLKKHLSKVPERLSPEAIRTKLSPNTQVVEYVLLEGRLVVWVLSGNTFQTIDVSIDGQQLNDAISGLGSLQRNRNSSVEDRKPYAAQLYQTLAEPLLPYLDPSKHLVIIPDKSLYYVPFASLIDREDKFLIQRFTISYAPSAAIFVSACEKGAALTGKPDTLLSIGNPAFDKAKYPGLSPLESAETEAREVASIFPNSKVLTGASATKEQFMRAIGNTAIIHFAGHYVPSTESASHSKLIFAQTAGESDLMVSDISEQKLTGLKLVVLSACDTGIGSILQGEGLIGASRAFLIAGAPVIVASRWKVDSEATEKLMVAFHRNRLQKGMNSAAALRQAQLEMIEDKSAPYSSPYFWAAFSVIGGLES